MIVSFSLLTIVYIKFIFIFLLMKHYNTINLYLLRIIFSITFFESCHLSPLTIFIFFVDKDAQIAIQWSEALDEVFTQNYNSDPALSWQYFGSSTGIMRHYPAMKWIMNGVDLFDCRIRTWFIEAATCTKDVIILIDNSGSMQGIVIS